jgi:hypothetical protein
MPGNIPDKSNWLRDVCKSPVAALCERRGWVYIQENSAVTDRRYNPIQTFAEISFRVDEFLERFPQGGRSSPAGGNHTNHAHGFHRRPDKKSGPIAWPGFHFC